jgi:ABC-type glycerol-3-phosphate transport system substrate-binding protein
MKNFTLQHLLMIVGAVVGLIVLTVAAPRLCSTKKPRAPGPLVVWLIAEPKSQDKFKEFGDRFKKSEGLDLKLEFKQRYELRTLLRDHPDQVLGQVDLMEVDLFDLEAAAPAMEDLTPYYRNIPDLGSFYPSAGESGEFDGKRLFVPWRLSWPMMLAPTELSHGLLNWDAVAETALKDPGSLYFPVLRERELFALTMALVWSYGGDPNQPEGEGFRAAIKWLARVRSTINPQSLLLSAAEVPDLGRSERPHIFFEWPEGAVPLVRDASIPEYFKPLPLPCGRAGRCPLFAIGRFLGVPQDAPHREDAEKFITHLTSVKVQSEMVYASLWLPMRQDGWGDLGVRQQAYEGFRLRGKNLEPMPRPLAKLEHALAKTVRQVLMDGQEPDEAIAAYKTMLQEKTDEGEDE